MAQNARPADAASNGPAPEAIRTAIRELALIDREVEKGSARRRNRIKSLRGAGFPVDAMLRVMRARKQDPDVIRQEEAEYRRVAQIDGLALFEKAARDDGDPFFDMPEKERREHMNFLADEVGYQAGRAGTPRDQNPHHPGAEIHVAWDGGWLAGQAAIAYEMAGSEPPERKKPGRKKKGDEASAETAGESGEAGGDQQDEAREEGAEEETEGDGLPTGDQGTRPAADGRRGRRRRGGEEAAEGAAS